MQKPQNNLNTQAATPATTKKKSSFWQYLLPAFISLALLLGLPFYFHIKPSYEFDIKVNNQLLWQVSGNDSSIKITSVNPWQTDSQPRLWFSKANDSKPYPIGLIPNNTKQQSVRYSLPQDSHLEPGDQFIISATNVKADNLLDNNDTLVITLSVHSFN